MFLGAFVAVRQKNVFFEGENGGIYCAKCNKKM